VRDNGGKNGTIFSNAAIVSSGAVAKLRTVIKLNEKRIVITIQKGIEIMEAKRKWLNAE
jgi:hypothetical protein